MQTLAWHNLLGTNRNYIDKFAVFDSLAGNNFFQSFEALTCETKNTNTQISTVIDNWRSGDSMCKWDTLRNSIIYWLWDWWVYVCLYAEQEAAHRHLIQIDDFFSFIESPLICLCQIKLATSYSHLLWRPSTVISQFFLMWAYAHGHFVNILCVRYPNSNKISPPHRIGDTVKAQNASSSVHRREKKRGREREMRMNKKWMKKNKSLIDIFRCSPGENGFFFLFLFSFHSNGSVIRLRDGTTTLHIHSNKQEGSSRTHYLSFITSERRNIYYYL